MKWNRNFYESTAEEADDLSSVPTGGRGKMIVTGIIFPALLFCYAINCWLDGEALWYVMGGRDIVVYGRTAKAAAVAYSGVSLFCHARWFWGLLPNYLVYSIGVVLGLIGFIAGFCCGQFFMMSSM